MPGRTDRVVDRAWRRSQGGCHKTRRAPHERENFVPAENRLPKRGAPRERFVASRGAPPPRRGPAAGGSCSQLAALAGPPST